MDTFITKYDHIIANLSMLRCLKVH